MIFFSTYFECLSILVFFTNLMVYFHPSNIPFYFLHFCKLHYIQFVLGQMVLCKSTRYNLSVYLQVLFQCMNNLGRIMLAYCGISCRLLKKCTLRYRNQDGTGIFLHIQFVEMFNTRYASS